MLKKMKKLLGKEEKNKLDERFIFPIIDDPKKENIINLLEKQVMMKI